MYLLLAIFWLVFGVGWLIFDELHPESIFLTLPGTNVSAAWISFLFAAYNLLRWWSGKAARRRRALRRPLRSVPGEQSSVEPNPDFDFDDLRRG